MNSNRATTNIELSVTNSDLQQDNNAGSTKS